MLLFGTLGSATTTTDVVAKIPARNKKIGPYFSDNSGRGLYGSSRLILKNSKPPMTKLDGLGPVEKPSDLQQLFYHRQPLKSIANEHILSLARKYNRNKLWRCEKTNKFTCRAFFSSIQAQIALPKINWLINMAINIILSDFDVQHSRWTEPKRSTTEQ